LTRILTFAGKIGRMTAAVNSLHAGAPHFGADNPNAPAGISPRIPARI
jgi:hypothetical protein